MTRAEREAELQERGIPPYRQTGRTTRTLWKALLAASETDDATVAVVVLGQNLARHTFRMLRELAAPVHGCDARDTELRFVLPNGSQILVMSSAVYVDRLRGVNALVLEDHR